MVVGNNDAGASICSAGHSLHGSIIGCGLQDGIVEQESQSRLRSEIFDQIRGTGCSRPVSSRSRCRDDP